MKFENMSWEILEAIKECYDDNTKEGEELIKDCLLYLKELNDFKDEKLDKQILDWLEEHDFCVDCGNKLQPYEWYETHTELDGSPREYFTTMYCPICDKYYD